MIINEQYSWCWPHWYLEICGIIIPIRWDAPNLAWAFEGNVYVARESSSSSWSRISVNSREVQVYLVKNRHILGNLEKQWSLNYDRAIADSQSRLICSSKDTFGGIWTLNSGETITHFSTFWKEEWYLDNSRIMRKYSYFDNYFDRFRKWNNFQKWVCGFRYKIEITTENASIAGLIGVFLGSHGTLTYPKPIISRT